MMCMLDDVAYMDNEEERLEYVLADHGRIWVGSEWSNWGIPWVFGQVLEKAKKPLWPTALAHALIVQNRAHTCSICLALTELTRLGVPKCLYGEKLSRLGG